MLNSIELATKKGDSVLIGPYDRALISLMELHLRSRRRRHPDEVRDFYVQKRRGWVRLHEKAARSPNFPATTIWNRRSTNG